MAVPIRRAAIQVRAILGMSKHSRGGLQDEPVLHSHGPPACSKAASPWPGYLFDQITTHLRILTFCCQDLQQHAAWARRSDSSNGSSAVTPGFHSCLLSGFSFLQITGLE